MSKREKIQKLYNERHGYFDFYKVFYGHFQGEMHKSWYVQGFGEHSKSLRPYGKTANEIIEALKS